MDRDRERTSLRLLEEILDLPASERDAALRERTDDAELRESVRSLLAQEAAGDLDPGDLPLDLLGVALLEGSTAAPTLDGYRVIDPLGEGGMGRVFLAEQEEPRRRVALKTLRAGLDTEQARQRFRYEAEVLARLHHPGIAQVFATGEYEESGPFGVRRVPYLAMEYVVGARDLLTYADEERLDRDQRLRLVLEVSDAIAHAHALGVLHRDLKASNLLVDAEGRVKVIDFGIARAADLEGGATPHTPTRTRGLLGTPSAVAPERLADPEAAADTRSDVYAIGVVLFELVCGSPPHDLRGLPLHEATRRVLEHPPHRPSRLGTGIGRDLEAVLLRAIDRDPERRYPTADALSRDIERFLASEPVDALPPSLLHGLTLLARRHRLAIAAGAALLLTIVAGVATSTLFGVRATRAAAQERDARDREAQAARAAEQAELQALAALDLAEAAKGRLVDLSLGLVFDFGSRVADLPGATQTRLEALKVGVRHLAELEDFVLADPVSGRRLLEAWLELGDQLGNPRRSNIGDMAGAREAYDRAQRLLEALVERGLAAENHRLLEGLLALRRGDLASADGDVEAMEREYGRYLDAAVEFDAAAGLASEWREGVARALSQYGMARGIRGDHDAAYRAFAEARRIHAARVANRPADLSARAAFAGATAQLGAATYRAAFEGDRDRADYLRAADYYREALAGFDSLRAEQPDSKHFIRNSIETGIPASEVLMHAGDFDEAEEVARASVELAREAVRRDPADVDMMRFDALASFNVGLVCRERALAVSVGAARTSDLEAARAAFEASFDGFAAMESRGYLMPREQGYLVQIRAAIDEVSELLSAGD
jgi:serine/threonine protein kinase